MPIFTHTKNINLFYVINRLWLIYSWFLLGWSLECVIVILDCKIFFASDTKFLSHSHQSCGLILCHNDYYEWFCIAIQLAHELRMSYVNRDPARLTSFKQRVVLHITINNLVNTDKCIQSFQKRFKTHEELYIFI